MKLNLRLLVVDQLFLDQICVPEVVFKVFEI